MDIDTMKRSVAIQKRIEICRNQIAHAEYTQAEGIAPREIVCTFNGIRDGEMVIPVSLWRVVGQQVLTEYRKELSSLVSEFESL